MNDSAPNTFTPGPWENDGEDIIAPDIPCIVISAKHPFHPGRKRVCNVDSDLNDETDEFIITDENKANANLISAAPEMYEILDKINAAFYTRTSRKEWLELMEKTKPLLQKARGEL